MKQRTNEFEISSSQHVQGLSRARFQTFRDECRILLEYCSISTKRKTRDE